jgi:hypothetical protein
MSNKLRPAAGMYGTALQAAGCMGMDIDDDIQDINWFRINWFRRVGPVEDYLDTITLLLEKGADPNVKGGNLF